MENYTRINNEEETDKMLSMLNPTKMLTKAVLQKTFHHVWFNTEIESADKYVDVFDCLMQATEGDVIAVHINSPGGDLDTAIQIIDALESTPATTIAFLEGQACSAGSMIAMACENVEVSEYAYMMIHTFYHATGGKFSDIQTSTDFYTKWWSGIFDRLYKDFCTEEEIEEILAGKELWLGADEIVERFKRRKDARINREAKSAGHRRNIIKKIVDSITKNDINIGEVAMALKQQQNNE